MAFERKLEESNNSLTLPATCKGCPGRLLGCASSFCAARVRKKTNEEGQEEILAPIPELIK